MSVAQQIARADELTALALAGAARSSSTQQRAMSQPLWVIDPIDGSDSNDGTSRATALKTGGAVIARWGARTPQFSTPVEVQWTSSAPASDPFVVDPICVQQGSLLLTNAGLTVAVATTISVFTPKNRPAGTLNKITAVGVPSWAPYVGALVHDVTAGATFFIDADLGGGVAEITEPLATSSVLSLFGPPAVAIASGHAIEVYAPLPTVYMPSVSSQTISGSLAQVQLQGLHVRGDIIARFTRATFGECTFGGDGDVIVGQAVSNFDMPVYNSCRFGAAGGFSCYQGQGNIIGGSLQGAGAQFVGNCFVDGDFIVRLRIHHRAMFLTLGSVYLGQVVEAGDGPDQYVAQPSAYGPAGGPCLWGPGTLNISRGSRFYLQSFFTAAASILVTGGITLDGVATGYTFNLGTGAFSAGPVALTQAALDTNKSFQNPRTGSLIAITP